jgi:shikimate kinase
MNLVLIGYRGTGKSTVAKLLASRLGMEVVSLDQEIVREAGRSIPEIVAQHGWPHFRDLESAVTKRVAARDRIIIDAGGGVILRAENVENLKRGGRLVWLRASVPVIVARIESGGDRPALTAGKTFTEEVEDVLRERTPLYEAAADYRVDTDGRIPADVAGEVARYFNNR